ncbi:histidine kinase [Pseudomonas mohnii]
MKTQKKIKGKKLSLDQSIFTLRREERPAGVIKRVVGEVVKFDAANELDLIEVVASHTKLPEKFNPLFNAGREHYDVVLINEALSPVGFVYWLFGLFKRNASALKEFNSLRDKVSGYILRSLPDEALRTILEVEELSKCWWAICMKVHVMKELKKEDTKPYLLGLQASIPNANISNSVFRLQMMAESSSIRVFVGDIRARLQEYRTSGIQQAIESGDLESCRHLPQYLDSERKLDLAYLKIEGHESIIDQYTTFKEVVLELAANNQLDRRLAGKIFELCELIGDEELKCAVVPVVELSPIVQKIVDDYTLGKYSEVVSSVENLLVSGGKAVSGLIEIYAKSKIYLGSPHKRNTLFDTLASDFSSILQCETNTAEKIEYITKFSIKFRGELWAKSISFHLLSILEETAESGIVDLARLGTLALGEFNTPKAANKVFKMKLVDKEQLAMLPDYRAAKYFIEEKNKDVVCEALFPVRSDYLKLRSSIYLDAGDVIGCVNFAISEYMKNSVNFYHLPFAKLCGLIVEVGKDGMDDYIACLIALDVCAKELSLVFEEYKAELFEEFMLSNGTHRPSRIFTNRYLTSNEIFFLQNICIPSQLDNLFQFRTNDEVVHERVAIIDLLIEAMPEKETQLRDERDNVLVTLFSEKLRAKIESGKLFVDVQALESMRKHVYTALFDQAKSVVGGILLEPVDSESALASSKDLFKVSESNAIASTEKTEILYSIHVHAVEDFALNENYGLDKYLSAEVRHMVFVTQLRSCFEKTRLVTVQKSGEYTSNEYWLARYNFVNPSITQSVDSFLRIFSEKVDIILNSTNERFRVETRKEVGSGIFDFTAYHHRLVKLSRVIDESNNADIFFNSLIDYMWEMASESAKLAQLLIANDLSVEVNDLITRLEESINEAKGDVAMIDLMQEIKTARSLFTSQIEVVVNWFKFVGGQSSQNLERLGVVIEASVSSFESIYGHHECEISFTQSKSHLQLTYREARSLFIAIFTALENSVKYGSRCGSIEIEHRVSDSHNIIIIKNSIPAGEVDDPQALVKAQKEKWTPAHAPLNRKEGGTGLYKIFSTLTNTSDGFSFDIGAKHDEFVAIMSLKNEYFDNRG